MIFLLLSILSSTALVLFFKLFDRWGIRTFQAIAFNYLTAAACGFLFVKEPISLEAIVNAPWFGWACVAGTGFIIIFYLIATTAQKVSITVSSVANKMSVVVPVTAAVILYNDSMGLQKIIGIVLALVGVLLASLRGEAGGDGIGKYWIYPLLLFLGSGFLDTLAKYVEHFYLQGTAPDLYVSTLFAIAFTAGIIIFLATVAFNNKRFHGKSIAVGLALGIPNYASIYFLMRSLELKGLESSAIFPINNMGIVALSAVAAFLFFKEKLSFRNWLGIGLSVLAIALIAFA